MNLRVPPICFLVPLLAAAHAAAQQPAATSRPALVPHRWSGTLAVPDPVACTVDAAGRVFVTVTARRKTADLDIRQWSEWIPDDVSLTSVEAKSDFLRRALAPGVLKGPRGDLRDWNKDGIVDWNDLTVPAERILLFEDRNGDGTADHVQEFAGGFASDVTGIAAGVLAADGAVFTTIAPDLWRLEDRDADGKAETRRSMVHGFGIHIAYGGHDMHGLTLGPDGRIYWTIGDKGVNVTRPDGSRVVRPHEGCVLRCEPDGSGFEIFAHGLRNVQEIAFNETGDLFGVDNDADKPGEKERLVWILPDSDAGWRCSWQYMGDWCPWTSEGRWRPAHAEQPLFLTPPLAESHDGPSGFVFNPGTALAPEWNGWFFLNQFPSGRMNALRLEPSGAGWRLAEDVRVGSGIMGVGMSWGPDGRLYFADWEGDYALNGKGAVWRTDVAPDRAHPLRGEVQRLLGGGCDKLSGSELVPLLGHADQRVRIAAQRRLGAAGSWDLLRDAATDKNRPSLARRHALYGLAEGWRRGRLTNPAPLAALLADPDPELRTLAARVAPEAPADRAATDALTTLLSDPAPRVRLHAALACGRVRPGGAVEKLLALADQTTDDAFMRHAVVTGLANCAAPERLVALATDAAPARRALAVLTLARMGHAGTSAFLTDAAPRIAEAAAIAIHDGDGIPDALPALGGLLDKASGSLPESVLRRAMGARARSGKPEAAAALAAFAARPDISSPLRLAALEMLGTWTAPPRLDPVDGFVRSTAPREAAPLREALQPHLAALLAAEGPALQAAVLRAALALKLPVPPDRLAAAAADRALTAPVRAAAIQLLAAAAPELPLTRATVESALGVTDAGVATAALDALMALDPAAACTRAAETARSHPSLRVRQAALLVLGRLARPEAARALADLLKDPAAVPPGQLLDALEAAAAYPELAETVSRARAIPDNAPVAVAWRDCLEGGDPAAGREIVRHDVAANCTACHRFDASGGSEVGPALDGIGRLRDRAALVEALVNPGATVADGYGMVSLTLTDGTVLGGILLGQNADEVTLRLPDGTVSRHPRPSVKELTSPISIMPPMEAILTRREIRDVVAYLATLRAAPRREAKPAESH